MIAAILNSPWLLVIIISFFILLILKTRKELFLPLFTPSLISTLFLGKSIKALTQINRPFVENPQVLGVSTNIPSDYAFPSLHTALITIIAWTMTVIWPKFCYLGFLAVLAIAYSRVALGLHTWRDIAGGFVIATAIFWFFLFFANTKEAKKWSQNANLRRKIVHLFYGLALAFLVSYHILTPSLFTLFALSLTLILLFNHLFPITILQRLITYFEREPQPKFLGEGPLFFTWSSLLATLLFSTPIATVAIINLAVGDSVNALVGYYLNNRHLKKKRLEASLAAALAATIISLQYLPLKLLIPAIITTTILEFSEPKLGHKKIDDNLFIPLVSGGVIFLTQKLLPN